MSHQTDFIDLYRELGIQLDCSMDEFQLAYRRRVADLHPDRAGASGEEALKSLNLRYAAAFDFHRHYGRLPGAAPAPAPGVQPKSLEPLGPLNSPQQYGMEDALPGQSEGRGPSKVIVYGMMLVAALLIWWLSRYDTASTWIRGGGIAMNERDMGPETASALRLGMSPHSVITVLGEPASREYGDKYWVYGSSWVRFECEAVVDWYSSPPSPLQTSRSRPPRAVDRVARRCP